MTEPRPVQWEEFKAWLLAHGINPDREMVASVIWRPPLAGANGDQAMEVTTYRLREDGHPYKDHETDQAATETRVVPMFHLPGETP